MLFLLLSNNGIQNNIESISLIKEILALLSVVITFIISFNKLHQIKKKQNELEEDLRKLLLHKSFMQTCNSLLQELTTFKSRIVRNNNKYPYSQKVIQAVNDVRILEIWNESEKIIFSNFILYSKPILSSGNINKTDLLYTCTELISIIKKRKDTLL